MPTCARIQAVGFSLWKRPFAKPFIHTFAKHIVWTSNPNAQDIIITWGARKLTGMPEQARVIRMEDGFLHSAGLGSDLIAPMSQILDSQGIYFDVTRPNNLTEILNNTEFTQAELTRAEGLRQAICKAGLTKYNLGRQAIAWQKPEAKKLILVPGQVADDASVQLGSAQIKTIEVLLQTVRSQNPNAFIVYKPHPDVLSGNRRGLIEAQSLCDILDTNADIISLIEVADEVHTLSSLAGFDALLRQKTVVTYGMPFYAGWGLTIDQVTQIPFRQRKINLQTLVAASLIRYPIYWDWTKNEISTPEVIVERLAAVASRDKPAPKTRCQRILFNIARWLRNVTLYYLGKEYKES